MSIPALPPTSTERWFYDYVANDVQHTLIMRTSDEREASAATEALDAFLTSIAGNLSEITTVGLRVARIGSNITLPQDTTGLASTYGSTPGSAINVPLQVTFTGRSTDGHKARVGIFGWLSQTDASWRISRAEDADVASGLDSLAGLSTGGFFTSISGHAVLWNQYANIGYNDHWIKNRRKAGGTA